MNRSKLIVILLVAIVALAAAVFFWNPASEALPSGSEFENSSAEMADGAEPSGSPDLAEAQIEADTSAERTRTESFGKNPQAGLIAQASSQGGTFQIRALSENGNVAAPATFLVENSRSQIEWIEREDGILRLSNFEQLKSAAVLANGQWSKPRDFGGQETAATIDLPLLHQSGSITLRVTRNGVGIEKIFQCKYGFRDQPMDLGTAIASTFNSSNESSSSKPEESRLFFHAFRVLDFTDNEAEGKDGVFELQDVPPGNYQFHLRSEFGVPFSKSTPLAAGEALELNIELENGGWLEGRVLDANGKPIAKANVIFQASLNNFADAFSQKRMRKLVEYAVNLPLQNDRAKTDSTGNYRLGPLPVGGGAVFAGTPDLLPDMIPQVQVDSGQTQTLSDMHLKQGHNVAVLITDAISGEVLQDSIVGWNVTQEQLGVFQAADWEESNSKDIDEQGRVVLRNLPFENLGLRVKALGHATYTTEYLMPMESWDPKGPIPVLNISLVRGLRLHGQVLDAGTGEGVPGAKVFAITGNTDDILPGLFQQLAGDRFPSTETDEEGRFAIESLAEGDYIAQVQHEDFAPARSETVALAVGMEPEVTLALKPGGTLIAHYNGADGNSEANRSIILVHLGLGSTQTETTDEEGMAFFEQLPAGNFQIATMPGGSDPTEITQGNLELDFVFVELMDGATKIVELGPGLAQCTLEGVITKAGEPLSEKSLTLLGTSGLKATRSDDDGHYFLEGLRAGEYSFFAGETTSPSYSGTLTIAVGSNTLNIALPEGEITVKVTEAATGNPVPGVPVTVNANDTRGNPSIKISDSEGLAVFPDIKDGDYRVSAGAAAMPIFGGNSELGSKTIDVSVRNSATSVDIQLEAGATFKARILGTQGQPVSGASMFYLREDGSAISGLSLKASNSSGVAQLVGLPAGPGLISVKHPEFGQAEISVQLLAGELVKQEIQLETGTFVYIQATDDSDQPAAGVYAVLEDSRGARISMLYSMQDAQAVNQALFSGQEQKLGPVPAGAYTLKLFRLGGTMKSHKVQVPPGTPELHLRYAF